LMDAGADENLLMLMLAFIGALADHDGQEVATATIMHRLGPEMHPTR
jgi:hypothetical protein